MKQFWNTVDRHKIDCIKKTNPEQARMMYEDYIKKYPKDYEAKFLYASVLINLKELDFAYDIIKDTKSQYEDDINLKNSHHVKKIIDGSAFIAETRCLAYMNKFDELLDLLDNQTIEKQRRYGQLRFYCLVKLGLISEEDLNCVDSYKKKQLFNYSYDRFRDYIRRYSYDSEVKKDSVFAKDFPMNKVLSEVYKSFDDDKCLYLGQVTDTYVFKYDLCGIDKDITVDYLKVICIHGTHDIITVLPSQDCDKLPYVDLNHINEIYNNHSRPSQIDKFYKKYKI